MRGAKFYCNYCQEIKLITKQGEEPTKDHFLPRSKGGTGGKVNSVICCKKCNSMKGNQIFSSIEDVQKYILGSRMIKKQKEAELKEHPNGTPDMSQWKGYKGCG